MSFFKVFDIAGSALSAQQLRLNVTSSNLANADTASGSKETAYRARMPVFSTVMDELGQENQSIGVKVKNIVQSTAPAIRRYAPNNPIADKDGYIYMPNVNGIEEMANMISASRSFQNNVEVFNTTKQMMLRTLTLGQ